MKAMWLRLGLVLCVLAMAGCSSTRRGEPVNLSDAKAAVAAYVDDGRYERDLAAVATEAGAWITRRAAARREGERLAVVFDIDETVLSNLPHMRGLDFGYVPAEWEAWVARGEAPVIPAGKAVYDAARAAGVAVLFLTGREEPRDRAGTEANLRRAGLGDYAELRLAPAERGGRTAAEIKAAERAAWTAAGWTIIAAVGDQESDLGAPAERSFKFPNPVYRID